MQMLFDSGCVNCSNAKGPICVGCAAMLRAPPSISIDGLDSFRALWEFDDVSRHLVASFKYRGDLRAGRWCAKRLASIAPRALDAITWVPTTHSRRVKRGYDQAAELSRAVAAEVGMGSVAVLTRLREEAQTGGSRAHRLEGPRLRAIRGSPAAVALVDDVVTTGSSMRAAAAALRRAGASRVVGLALAVTPKRLPLRSQSAVS